MSWDQETFSSKKSITIGYITSLAFFPPIGDTEEAVRTAKVELEKAGHKLLRFDMPDGNDGMEINKLFSQLASADGGRYLRETLEKEPEVSEDISETWPLLLAPAWKRALLLFMARQSWLPSYSKRLSMLSGVGACSSFDFWSIWRRRNELRTEVLDKMRESSIDALISPVFAFPAVNMEDTRKLVSASYTQTWSLLDFPVGVTRFGTESGENIDSYDDEDDSLLKLAKKAAGNSKGMPIGLQVIGKPFEEETVLRVMCLLDSLYTNPL
jgi:Asp-tRNA(Asn)/Glu-tRNA(Gln) amidotransferase A subunit family amidase